MSLLKKFGSLGAIWAFVNSPTGQKLITKAKDVATDPRTKAKAAELAGKIKRPAKEPTVVDARP